MVVMFVLFSIIAFLTIDYMVQRTEARKTVTRTPHPQLARAVGLARSRKRRRTLVDPDRVPGGVFISPSHVWLCLEPCGSVRVGVDPLLIAFLGGVDCVYALPPGTQVRQDGPLVMLRRGQRALRIRSPIDGVVSEVNDRARRVPNRIPSDPYRAGWIYRISPTGISRVLKTMSVGEDAAAWMDREIGRLRDLLCTSTEVGNGVQARLTDGGLPIDELSGLFSDAAWERLIASFFSGAECRGRSGRPSAQDRQVSRGEER